MEHTNIYNFLKNNKIERILILLLFNETFFALESRNFILHALRFAHILCVIFFYSNKKASLNEDAFLFIFQVV